jgi:hypothetical protein
MIRFSFLGVLMIVAALAGCTAPGSPIANPAGPSASLSDGDPTTAASWGPEIPNFNLEVVLRGDSGFGLVKFRQPNDTEFIVHLDVWVRDLLANTAYRLQRAVDTTIDGTCTSTAWLTLGEGLTPRAIVTDDNGTGRAALWRAVPTTPGSSFDIHFRVIEDATGSPVLQSGCDRYAISL